MLAIYHYWDSLNSIEIRERLKKTKEIGFDAVCLLRDAYYAVKQLDDMRAAASLAE